MRRLLFYQVSFFASPLSWICYYHQLILHNQWATINPDKSLNVGDIFGRLVRTVSSGMWHTSSKSNFSFSWVARVWQVLRVWQERRGWVAVWGAERGLGGWGSEYVQQCGGGGGGNVIVKQPPVSSPHIQWPAASTIVQTAEQWASFKQSEGRTTLGWQQGRCEEKQGES